MSREVLDYLAIRPDSRVADLTAGMGGHSRLIAERLETGLLVMNDRDGESLALAAENTREFASRIRPTQGPFSSFAKRAKELGIERFDGLLMDLGVSMYQLTTAARGFSFRLDGPLDMRMDAGSQEDLTAAEVVNTYAEHQFADLIYQFGEEGRSRAIARAVVRARPITSTRHLAQVIESVVAPRPQKPHPATKTFMALRLYVNREMEELTALLEALAGLMAPGGRVVALTFMSTEDRIVKRSFQAYHRAGQARILTKHVVPPGDDELRENPASRSAKLRALEWGNSTA